MNKVVLMGRLTRDPEVRYTQGGKNPCVLHVLRWRWIETRKGKREDSQRIS